jgi:hypothetical protein
MTVGTLARYLVGDRRAIEEFAASRWSLLIGFLLVLTGGLARNYDGAYLVKEWPVLLHGPIISTVNALVLFTIFFAVTDLRKGRNPAFLSGFLGFLGLFWLTAPMAWLYAVPYERFLEPVTAVEANLWTLACVSAWRVALMTRVLTILYSARAVPAALVVLLFADVVVFAAATLSPHPIVDLMGGLQQSPEDALLGNVSFLTGLWSLMLSPVLLVACLIGTAWLRPNWTVAPAAGGVAPWGAVSFSAAALAAWIPITIWAQGQQRVRWETEDLLRRGDIAEGLAMMSGHRRSDYPRIWDPPPRLTYRETDPPLDQMRRALASADPAAWVRETYCDKSWTELSRHTVWRHIDPTDRESLIETIERGQAYIRDEVWPALDFHVQHDPRLTAPERDRLSTLIAHHKGQPAGE